ncbi:MAG: TadE/TadG family type IV pilus assembly protein [Sneathiella sp.]
MEFGLIFPVILALAFTGVEAGKMLVVDNIMQSAANALVIQLRHKSAEERTEISADTVASLLTEILSSRGNGWVDTENVTVQLLNLGQTHADAPSGGGGDQMRYLFSYEFQPTTPISILFLNASFLSRSIEITSRNGAEEI